MKKQKQIDHPLPVGILSIIPGVTVSVIPPDIVTIVAEGSAGTLALVVNAGKAPCIAVRDTEKKEIKYKGCWNLLANGHLRGWIVDEDDQLQWIGKPKTRRDKGHKRTAQRARKGPHE